MALYSPDAKVFLVFSDGFVDLGGSACSNVGCCPGVVDNGRIEGNVG
jgi:hypothetical protein